MTAARNEGLLAIAITLLAALNAQPQMVDSPILIADGSMKAQALIRRGSVRPTTRAQFLKFDVDKDRATFYRGQSLPFRIDFWGKDGTTKTESVSPLDWHIASPNGVYVYPARQRLGGYSIQVVTPGKAMVPCGPSDIPGFDIEGVEQRENQFAPASLVIGDTVHRDIVGACIHYCPDGRCEPIDCRRPNNVAASR